MHQENNWRLGVDYEKEIPSSAAKLKAKILAKKISAERRLISRIGPSNRLTNQKNYYYYHFSVEY